MSLRTRSSKLSPFRDSKEDDLLDGCVNLGPKSCEWLRRVGVVRLSQVRALGPVEVCRRLRAGGYPVSLLMAYALQGALEGSHWNAIAPEVKVRLKSEFTKRVKPIGRAGR
jgi:DNA transformation protein and related proteins